MSAGSPRHQRVPVGRFNATACGDEPGVVLDLRDHVGDAPSIDTAGDGHLDESEEQRLLRVLLDAATRRSPTGPPPGTGGVEQDGTSSRTVSVLEAAGHDTSGRTTDEAMLPARQCRPAVRCPAVDGSGPRCSSMPRCRSRDGETAMAPPGCWPCSRPGRPRRAAAAVDAVVGRPDRRLPGRRDPRGRSRPSSRGCRCRTSRRPCRCRTAGRRSVRLPGVRRHVRRGGRLRPVARMAGRRADGRHLHQLHDPAAVGAAGRSDLLAAARG